MDLKAVFFDKDGTLVNMPVKEEQLLFEVYQKLGYNFNLEQISDACKKVSKEWEDLFSDFTRRTREAYVDYNRCMLETLGAKGNLQKMAEAVQDYWESLPNEEIYPEVESVLNSLQQRGIILGVLSNRSTEFSLNSLQKHGISDYFHFIISPNIAASPKGKKGSEMWEFALSEVGQEANQVLYIDNDYEVGVVEAKRAGLQAILIDRTHKYTSDVDCPIIHDLTEILKMIHV